MSLLAISLLATLLLLEGALQAAAYVAWLSDRKEVPEVPSGHDVVLCVGDSWTDGMGSSNRNEFSYPAQLSRLVDSSVKRKWTIVNCGQAGQNSRDVLSRLPKQLQNYEPRWVIVLVGQNDFWSRPDELPAGGNAVDMSQYRFRWRIPRLVAWGLGAIAGGQVAMAAREPMTGPDWQKRDLTVRPPYSGEPISWRSTSEARALIQQGRALDRQPELAEEKFAAALRLCPNHPAIHCALAGLSMRNGKPKEADRHVDWLRQRWHDQGGYWLGKQFVSVLNICSLNEEAATVCASFLDRYPKDAYSWRVLGRAQFHLRQYESALESFEESLRLAPDMNTFVRKSKLMRLGFVDEAAAITCLFDAYVACNDHVAVMRQLRAIFDRGNADKVERAFANYRCESPVRNRLRRILDELHHEAAEAGSGSSAASVLCAHLTQMANAIRNTGAEPVFLTYPFATLARPHVRRVARDLDVLLIDLADGFGRRIDPADAVRYKAADGHCNDAGYALMAELVRDVLAERLR